MSNTIVVSPHLVPLYAKYRELQRVVPDLRDQFANAARARHSWSAMLPEAVTTALDKLANWQVEFQIAVDLKTVRNIAAEANVEEAVADQFLRCTIVYHETSERYHRAKGKLAQLASALQNELFPV